MADDFVLTPTNNLEKHLDNILRTAQGEEPQYDLAPNWRIEQYLAAIASALASGGGGGGGWLEVTDTEGTLDKTWEEIDGADFAIIRYADTGERYSTAIVLETHSYKGTYEVYAVSRASLNYVEPPFYNTYEASSASSYPVCYE